MARPGRRKGGRPNRAVDARICSFMDAEAHRRRKLTRELEVLGLWLSRNAPGFRSDMKGVFRGGRIVIDVSDKDVRELLKIMSVCYKGPAFRKDLESFREEFAGLPRNRVVFTRKEICSSLEVPRNSQTLVQNALKRLESQGVVSRVGRGLWVYNDIGRSDSLERHRLRSEMAMVSSLLSDRRIPVIVDDESDFPAWAHGFDASIPGCEEHLRMIGEAAQRMMVLKRDATVAALKKLMDELSRNTIGRTSQDDLKVLEVLLARYLPHTMLFGHRHRDMIFDGSDLYSEESSDVACVIGALELEIWERVNEASKSARRTTNLLLSVFDWLREDKLSARRQKEILNTLGHAGVSRETADTARRLYRGYCHYPDLAICCHINHNAVQWSFNEKWRDLVPLMNAE